MISTLKLVSEQPPDNNCTVKELLFIHDIHNVGWDSFHFLIGVDSFKSVTAANGSEPGVLRHVGTNN